MSEDTPERPPTASAGAYHEIQSEVDAHFGGDWERFLKALSNPAEILHFVLWQHCQGGKEKFEAWATSKKLPPDWVPRFYGLLTPEGHLPARDETPEPAPESEQS